MRFMKGGLVSIAAIATAVVITAGAAQAFSKLDAPAVATTLELAKGKKKAGPGHCGTLHYWDKKTKSCADATKKKV